jgi:uncharacterized protein YjbI with pentapeptide repeats
VAHSSGLSSDTANASATALPLPNADLTEANLEGAQMDEVIGADFTGALNVPAKYLKD